VTRISAAAAVAPLAAALLLVAVEVASAQTPTPQPAHATADLRAASGESIGSATFTQAPEEVLISIAFRNRTALVGTHAIQVHSVGQCNPPGFDSAGPIFNPTRKAHGLLNSEGPMVGDLPNLVVGPAGVAVYNLSAPLATLQPGPNSLLGGQGTSLVVYDQPDDDKTQPEGNAGRRIACGAIVAGDAQPASAATPSSGRPDLLTALSIAVMSGLLIAGGVLLRRGA
jgi:Cu-Zn family superoxide dismutase